MKQQQYASGSGTSAAIKGHPLHPLLVTLPIGFLAGAAIADLVHAFAQPIEFWVRAAYWLLAGGLVTGAFAAIFGLWDLLAVRRARTMAMAWVHGLGNVAALTLAFATFYMRTPVSEPANAWMWSCGVVVILMITGLLGGEMVFRYGIGVSPGVGHALNNKD